MSVDALTVSCPDCAVEAGAECAHASAGFDGAHAARQALADLLALPLGHCAACGNPLLLDGNDTRHPDPAAGAVCAPMPDPDGDGWNTYAEAVNEGRREGYVDPSLWRPNLDRPLTWCPECLAGKHVNCTGEALQPDDTLGACGCTHAA